MAEFSGTPDRVRSAASLPYDKEASAIVSRWIGTDDDLGVDFTYLDLTGADFSGADLASGLFMESTMCGVSMRGTDLHRANMERVDLSCADLSHSDLPKATLDGSNLQFATLDHANLGTTSLCDVNARSASFREVKLHGAALAAGTMPSSVGEARTMGPVGAALAEFAKAKQDELMYIGARVARSMLGAQKATVAYLKGDQEMALDAQRAASAPLSMRTVKREAEQAEIEAHRDQVTEAQDAAAAEAAREAAARKAAEGRGQE